VITVAVGTFMAILDGSVANTALPTLARELHTSAAESIWVVNAFNLAVTMSLLTFASLGDALGYSRVYTIGLTIFTLGSLSCALSPTLPILIASRALQGLGSAAVMAVGPAIYRQIYPHDQLGRALGLSGVIVATSSAAGPTIGGTILAVAPWPWIFAINVPLGIFAVLFSRRALPREGGTGGRIDPASVVLSALGLGSTIFAIDGFARQTPLAIVALEAALGGACTLLFVRRSLRLPRPLIAFDLFSQGTFSLATLTALCTYVAQGLAFISLPFFFQSGLGRTPFQSGLLLTSWPLAVACIAPIAGRLSDRYPAGILSTIGLAILASGLALYAAMGAHPSAFAIVVHGAICGIGFGFFQSPNNRSLIGSAPRAKSGSAAGILATVRLSGQTLGVALVGIIFGTLGASLSPGGAIEMTARGATPIALWIACAFAATGGVLSGLRLGHRQVAASES